MIDEYFFQKSLDKKFSLVVKMRFAQNLSEVFLEIKNVLRSSIHNRRSYTGMPTARLTPGTSGWDLCAYRSLDGVDRQENQDGQERFELKT